jgi:putative CocE/NonD family hydrolase
VAGERYEVAHVETASMTTRDGVRLDADLYRPIARAAGETFPVLLMRQPYGRRIASTVVFAHPLWYAAHGYIVVIQDVRGRGTSAGNYALFVNDGRDGADAARWAAGLPGSNGRVGMYGFSYQGVTQLLAAATLLEETGSAAPLAALAPAMIGYRIHDDWVYEGGSFYLAPNIGWGIQMAAEAARLAGDEAAYLALRRGAGAPPLGEAVPARPALLMDHACYGHYADWVSQPTPGPYWAAIAPAGRLDGLDVPALHVGGWYDLMLPGTLAAYAELSRVAKAPQALAIGPWTHIDWSGRHPALRTGPAGESDIDLRLLAWFGHWLRDGPAPAILAKPVRLFEFGSNRWRDLDAWPGTEPSSLYLGGDGRAALVASSGTLRRTVADSVAADAVVLDPWRPTPTAGGHAGAPGGRVDRSAVDARADVLTYTGAALDIALTLAGDVAVELHCTCDRASFDVALVLSEVRPDGAAINITEGYRRVEPGTDTSPLRVELRPLAIRLDAGHALRLSVALASWPAHPLNTGDGTPSTEGWLIDAPITTLTVRHGGDTPSRLLLPVTAG